MVCGCVCWFSVCRPCVCLCDLLMQSSLNSIFPALVGMAGVSLDLSASQEGWRGKLYEGELRLCKFQSDLKITSHLCILAASI